jgi:cytochrome P450
MIEALMQQSYRDGAPLRDHEIAHIMIALLMAGQHTSSASGSWALLHLANNPDIAWVSTVSLHRLRIHSSDVFDRQQCSL